MNVKRTNYMNVMIKPASVNCNLACKYCFYIDESENRAICNYGIMDAETSEALIKNVFASVDRSVSFLFQGGEPTLAGLDYFKNFHKLVDKYNVNNIEVSYSLQTNATLLDHDWLEFLKKHDYLLGISLDGIRETNDVFRTYTDGRPSYDTIMKAIDEIRHYDIPFNILTVITNQSYDKASEIYEFYKANDFRYMQFIPAIDPLDEEKENDYYLSAANYGKFLDQLFNLWYADIMKGHFYSIRYFENLLLILMGQRVESCDMMGTCSVNTIVEADGSIYPCDFYVLDDYRLGNVHEDRLIDAISSHKAIDFIKASYPIPDLCQNCKFLKICRNGCRRYRDSDIHNKFCLGYYDFFEKNLDKLVEIKEFIEKTGA